MPTQNELSMLLQLLKHTRTRDLLEDFGKAFSDADKLFVAPVYPAGEKPIKGVSSDLIIKSACKNGKHARPFEGVLPMLKEISSGDVVITLGAGDVWKTGMEIMLKMEMLVA